MRKFILLILIASVFACDSDNDSDNYEPPTNCLSCTGVNFTHERYGETWTCNDEDISVICLGQEMDSACFPEGVDGYPQGLTIADINAIKTFWEEKGGTCILD